MTNRPRRTVADFTHVAYRHGCAGAGGMGKTTRIASILATERPQFVFAFDPKGQFSRLLNRPWVTRWGGIGAQVETGAVCYAGTDIGDRAAAFDRFCATVFDVCDALPGRKFLLVDEIQDYVTTNVMPEGFWTVIDTGRWHRLDLAFTCQYFNQIHNGLRGQLTHVSAFNHTEKRSADFLLENGFPARELAALGRGQYLTRQLIPPGPVLACDDLRGVRQPLPGQQPAESPVLASIFGKTRKRTR